MRPKPEDNPTKLRRYRTAQRRRGMKLLRVWVPDPSEPEFRMEARRQAALLHATPEEIEALHFIAVAADWPEA